MRASSRLALVPAALALAAYAGLAVWAGAQLRYTGSVYLYATAAILALGALGVAVGQLWGRAFALLFFVATGLVFAVVAVMVVRDGLSGVGRSDLGFVRGVVVYGIAAVALAGFVVSLTLCFLLVRAGRGDGEGDGLLSHALAWPLALAGVGAVAWMAGYHYAYRWLPLQDACLSGQVGRCYALAREERFSASERLLFARRGCEGGSTGACSLLAGRLGAGHSAQSPEALVLASQCERGNADVCLRLGAHLLRVSDREGASRYLSLACETLANRCGEAAKLADASGEAVLAEGVLRRGCERDDPTSCRRLLRKMERSAPQAERDAFHLRVCLITDVNECMPLIRRDAAAVCPVICEGATENRMQSCDHCARHAGKIGERALADRWWGGNCEKGHALSCVNLGLMYQELGQRNQAAPWFNRACDRARGVTLGCRYLGL